MTPYERALRQADLLTGPPSAGYLGRWLDNAARRSVEPDVVVSVARTGLVGSLHLLQGCEEITDRHGKSYFLLPQGATGAEARMAVLLAYVVNAGTDYAGGDFAETPYSAAEVLRIMDRQRANSWTYERDVRFVHRNGGRLAATPHGILMGLGGNWIQRLFSQRGGTTWGDIFMVNTPRVEDPAQRLREVIRSPTLDLDRLLHHEEVHSAQWAALGYAGMLRAYGWELLRELVFRKTNRLELAAGLRDGGYL
ncbi:hypothetical protein [Mycobacterium paragordonae]|uniref:Uncharacterized protein n=1 Tax=Mycobacterium paragordonae TaxID=1389713 RepID=A0ABQ1C814_9MYCO|nr:hypothetical protein [Mycobacterium paragordonae]GFG80482.1 hypothetical protein MPRG_37580 [Mycobacterium paragordonae]